MDEQLPANRVSHFEKLFEALLEKQQETSVNLKEIISERNSLWHEKIIPKIEQLYYKKREFHLNNEFLSLKSNRMDSLVKELIGRDDEKQFRLIETRNIVKNQFQDLFKLIGMEQDYLNNLTNFSKTGEDAKVFLKIPKKLDCEGQIDSLLSNVEENIRKEYENRDQLKYYDIARKFIEYFNKKEDYSMMDSFNNTSGHSYESKKTMREQLNKMREYIEDSFQYQIRKKIIDGAKYLLFCKIKFNDHYSFQNLLERENRSITTFDLWCNKYSIVERYKSEIRSTFHNQLLFSRDYLTLYNRTSRDLYCAEMSELSTHHISRIISRNKKKSIVNSIGLLSLIISDPIFVQDETIQHLRRLFVEIVYLIDVKEFNQIPSSMKMSILCNIFQSTNTSKKRQSYLNYLFGKYHTSQKDQQKIKIIFALINSGPTKLVREKKRYLEKQAMCIVFSEAKQFISDNDFIHMSKLYNIESTLLPLILNKHLELFSALPHSDHQKRKEEFYQLHIILNYLIDTFNQTQYETINMSQANIEQSIKYICQKVTGLVVSSRIDWGTVILVEEMFSLLESSYHALKLIPHLRNMIEHTLQSIIKR